MAQGLEEEPGSTSLEGRQGETELGAALTGSRGGAEQSTGWATQGEAGGCRDSCKVGGSDGGSRRVATLTVSSQREAAKRPGQRRGEGKNRKRAEAQRDGRLERSREVKLQARVI